MTMEPQDQSAEHLHRAWVLMRLGRREEALEASRAALERDSQSAVAHAALAVAAGSIRDWQTATSAANTAIALAPESPIGYASAAAVAMDAGRWSEAAAFASDLLRLAPENVFGFVVRASALLELGRVQDATVLLERGLERQPDSAQLMHVLAYCRLLETRFSEARTLLESALAIEPQAPEIHHNLGVLLAHTVGGDTGRSHIREAVRLNPQDAIFVASASARRAQNLEGLVRGAQLKLFWRYANAYIRFSMAAVLIVVSVWWPPAWPVLAWSGAMVLRARYERRLFEPRKSLAVSGLALSAALLLAAAVSSLPGSLAYLLPGIGAWSLQNAAITWPTQLGRSLLVLLFAASLAASGVVTISLGPEALVTSQLAIGYLYFVTAGLLMRLAKR